MQIILNDQEKTIALEGQSWWASYSAVNTPEGLLKCVYHLSEKSNRLSLADIRKLMNACANKFGYDVGNFIAAPSES